MRVVVVYVLDEVPEDTSVRDVDLDWLAKNREKIEVKHVSKEPNRVRMVEISCR